MPISLRQMRYALAVARTGHFGRAAAECGVTQPALSQQILSLEAVCGTPLFDRHKSGVQPTPFGREFIGLAEETVRRADAVNAFAQGQADRPARPIRFGLIPTVAPYLLPEIFPALAKGLPEPGFAISESRTEALLAGLTEGSLDIALIGTALPADGAPLVAQPLFDDPFVLATSRAEATERPVSLATLPPERILLLDEGHCFRDQTITACGLGGGPATRTFAATSLSTIVEFVANGQGMTLLPRIALRKEASDPRIAIHDLADPRAGRLLSLVWRAGSPFVPTFEIIARIIRATREEAA